MSGGIEDWYADQEGARRRAAERALRSGPPWIGWPTGDPEREFEIRTASGEHVVWITKKGSLYEICAALAAYMDERTKRA